MRDGLRFLFATILLLPLFLGCSDARPQSGPPPSAPDAAPAAAFDPARTGTIHGSVRWEGPAPEPPPFKVHTNWYPGKNDLLGLVRERPNVPRIDRVGKGVAQAVIFLRGVDPLRSRPWDHPPARIELRDMRLQVLQGDNSVQTGFVRRGDQFSMTSHDRPYHSLHAAGADYFTFTLAEPDRPRNRRPEHTGLIDLSSAAGYYWMRGYLFVDDHPYYTRSDAAGRFRLDKVPAGRYQLVCWLPNWNITRQERDPESSLVSRIFLAKPFEAERTVVVDSASDCRVDFVTSAAAFPK
jgi:hypothetical protein